MTIVDVLRPQARSTRWLVLGIGLLTFALSVLAIASPVDDAYIVYRYAERFASGEGLTFNDGAPVEGFTSLIWTLMLSACVRLGLPVVETSIGLSLAAIAASFAALWWALSTVGVRTGIRVFILFLFSCSTVLFKVALLGLEFGLFAALLLVFVTLMLRVDGIDSGNAFSAGVMAALAAGALFWTRPESALFLPGLVTLILVSAATSRPAPRATVISATLALSGFLILLGLTTLFRRMYFGQWIPQSVSAKSPFPWSGWNRESLLLQLQWIQDGALYLLEAYGRNPTLPIILVLALWLAFRRPKELEVLVVAIPILLHHGLMILFGGDWMPFDRFVSIFAVLYLLLLAIVLELLVEDWGWRPTWAMAAVLGLVYAASNLAATPLRWPPSLTSPVTGDHLYGAIGAALASSWSRSDVLLPEAIGRIAFAMPEATVLDPAGLVSPEVAQQKDARRSVYGRSHWPFAMSQRPSVVIVHSLFSNRKGRTIVAAGQLGYTAYCLPPLDDAIDGRRALILLRNDRHDRYRPAVEHLKPKPVSLSSSSGRNLDLRRVCSDSS